MGRALGDTGFRWGEGAATGPVGTSGPWSPRPAGVAVLALAVGVLLGSWLPWLRSTEAPGVEYSSLLIPEGRSVSPRTSIPMGISADGRRVVVRLENDEGVGEIWVYDRSEPQPRHVPAFDGNLGSVALSPDGDWIAFNSIGDAEIQRASIVGGTPIPIGPTGLEPDEAGFTGITYGPEGQVVFSTTGGLRRLREGAAAAEELTALDPDGELRHLNPSFLPDGSGVVFVERNRETGRQDVMILRFGEEAAARITQGHSPRVSSDGILVFGQGVAEPDGGTGSSSFALWAGLLDRDRTALDGQPVIVAQGVSAMSPATAPRLRYALADDGTLVQMPAAVSTQTDLSLVRRDGRAESLLDASNPQFPPGVERVGRGLFSPDGRRIALRAFFYSEPRFRVFIWDIEREVLNPVTVEVRADWPVWTPGGQRVAFNRFDAGERNLYWARADNRDTPEPLLPANPYEQHAQDFTEDGRYMIYTQRGEPSGPDSDLWVHALDGSREDWEIVGGPRLQRGAALSPDGRWMAYVSDESGQDEVYITDFPESVTLTKISNEASGNPVWSPSGDELFFTRDRGPALMAVPIATEPDLRPGVPVELFEGPFALEYQFGRGLDVSPDGEAFLMVWRRENLLGVPRIEVIENFTTLARERLGER
jgi:Tol biopolymer transport system component